MQSVPQAPTGCQPPSDRPSSITTLTGSYLLQMNNEHASDDTPRLLPTPIFSKMWGTEYTFEVTYIAPQGSTDTGRGGRVDREGYLVFHESLVIYFPGEK